MSLEDCLKDEVPAWQIEDKLTEARIHAQNGDMDKCEEATERALELLTKSPKELLDL